MTTQSEINLVFDYADQTSRKFVIGPYGTMTSSETAAVKASVKNFNSTELAEVAGLMLSVDGASCTGISAASITTKSTKDFNLGN